jgi:hypothetical protein|tara:strand:+ start:312 stop:869 length:558 start_codon:yes stop_codon:yes gene_type:complete
MYFNIVATQGYYMNQIWASTITLLLLGSISLVSGGEAWILTLEYKNGQVSLLNKQKTEALLKKSRKTLTSADYQNNHTSEFGFVLKNRDGKIIKTFEGQLPGKVHADFAGENNHHFQEYFQVIDTFTIVVPAIQDSEIEFFSRLTDAQKAATLETLHKAANLINSGQVPPPTTPNKLGSIGKIDL